MDDSSRHTDYSDTMSMLWFFPYSTQTIIWFTNTLTMLRHYGQFMPTGNKNVLFVHDFRLNQKLLDDPAGTLYPKELSNKYYLWFIH